MTPTCDYCGNPSELVTGDVPYPHRPDLRKLNFYMCIPCRAWVGCHPGTTKPLGRLADHKLRRAKRAAHAAFDPIWQEILPANGFKRSHARGFAYGWLARELGIPRADCHIGKMDEAMCYRVVELSARFEELFQIKGNKP